MSLDAARQRILDAALPRVAFTGWSPATLRDATRDAGYEPVMLERAFPGGVGDALAAFWRRGDQAMLDALADVDLDSMRIRERIATAVKARIRAWSDRREAVRHTLGLVALPRYAALGMRATAATVDEIWHAAGDRATDFNYYTKRLLLAGVLTSTLLYWLDDRSEDNSETWLFLDRRIADVMGIQKARAGLDRRLARIGPMLRRFSRPRRRAAATGG